MKMVKARMIALAAVLFLMFALIPGTGTTFVRAKYDGKTYRCKVTVVKRPSAPEEITFNGQEYTLAFADEFNSLDMSNWAYCPEMERQDAGGVWRRSCSGVKDGNLVITCDIADDGTPVSGGIRSVKEHERTYGLYHIRFKAEKADGLWYAFWLLNDNMEEPWTETARRTVRNSTSLSWCRTPTSCARACTGTDTAPTLRASVI